MDLKFILSVLISIFSFGHAFIGILKSKEYR